MTTLAFLILALVLGALTLATYLAWSKFMATVQALTDALTAITPKLAALSTSIDGLVAAQGTVPDSLVQQVTDISTGIDAIAAKVTAATPAA